MEIIENYQTIDSISDFFNTKSIIYYVFVFLAIYLISYFLMSLFFKTSDDSTVLLRLVRIVDICVFVFFVIFLVITYGNKNMDDLSSQLKKNMNDLKDFSDNEYSIISVIFFIVIFYTCIYIIRIPMSKELKPVSIIIIENIALILLAILFILNFFRYFLNINLLDDSFADIFHLLDKAKETTEAPSSTKASSSTKTTEETPKTEIDKDEVFNIRNNIYTYDDAQSVCSIYGATLATYDQIEKAYNNGAEWCNYGWSQDQLAFFPTQKSTWTLLQNNPSTKNSCGRPGINGGYFKNKNMQFGVNCYGKKPEPSDYEKEMMNANQQIPLKPLTPEERMLQTKLDIWKNNAKDFLVVNSFNKNEWSSSPTMRPTTAAPTTSSLTTAAPTTTSLTTAAPTTTSLTTAAPTSLRPTSSLTTAAPTTASLTTMTPTTAPTAGLTTASLTTMRASA